MLLRNRKRGPSFRKEGWIPSFRSAPASASETQSTCSEPRKYLFLPKYPGLGIERSVHLFGRKDVTFPSKVPWPRHRELGPSVRKEWNTPPFEVEGCVPRLSEKQKSSVHGHGMVIQWSSNGHGTVMERSWNGHGMVMEWLLPIEGSFLWKAPSIGRLLRDLGTPRRISVHLVGRK